MNLKAAFLGGVNLPLDLPELSVYKSSSMNLKLPISGG